MSYKTNPILNRIKINKGWKNPYFPTKTLNYARDITLWFKVYLLLKFFLNLKKIQLVSFEIRFDEKNKKILYLQINKKGNRKKKKKKTHLPLRKVFNQIQTPMLKDKNMGAVFFFYKNLPAFKKYSFWSQNVIQKRIFSKFWLTKPKTLTWLNSLEKVLKIRQKTKNTFLSANRQKNFLPIRHLKFQLYTNKQKQLLSQIAKIKKKHRFLCLQLLSLLQQKKKKFYKMSQKTYKKKSEVKKFKFEN